MTLNLQITENAYQTLCSAIANEKRNALQQLRKSPDEYARKYWTQECHCLDSLMAELSRQMRA